MKKISREGLKCVHLFEEAQIAHTPERGCSDAREPTIGVDIAWHQRGDIARGQSGSENQKNYHGQFIQKRRRRHVVDTNAAIGARHRQQPRGPRLVFLTFLFTRPNHGARLARAAANAPGARGRAGRRPQPTVGGCCDTLRGAVPARRQLRDHLCCRPRVGRYHESRPRRRWPGLRPIDARRCCKGRTHSRASTRAPQRPRDRERTPTPFAHIARAHNSDGGGDVKERLNTHGWDGARCF